MAKPPPPDPRKTKAVEIPHKQTLSLIVDPNDGGRSVLFNALTGEMCLLPHCPDDGLLHFGGKDDKFAFILMKGEPKWCKEYLSWTVCSLKGGEKFGFRTTDGGYECKWLSEFTGRYWSSHCEMTLVRFEQIVGASGCRTFFSLADALFLVKGSSPGGKQMSKKISKTYGQVIARHFGKSDVSDHILYSDRRVCTLAHAAATQPDVAVQPDAENQPHLADQSDANRSAAKDLNQLNSPMISTFGFITLLLHLVSHGHIDEKKKARRLLVKFLEKCGSPSFEVLFDQSFKSELSHSVLKGHLSLPMIGRLDNDSIVSHIAFKRLHHKVKSDLQMKTHLNMVDFMCHCFGKKECQWLCDQLIFEMTKHIEMTMVVITTWHRNESLAAKISRKKSKAELAEAARSHRKMKQKKRQSAVSSLGSFATSTIAQTKKKGHYVGFSKRQQQQMTRYWLGARRAFLIFLL